MNTTFEFNNTACIARLNAVTEKAQFMLDQRVLADSNQFVPHDMGTLEESGILASEGGQIEWDTPYARYQYYEAPNKSKDVNPRATMKWFEVAKRLYKKTWVSIAQKEFD
jgi:hypothetical protein